MMKKPTIDSLFSTFMCTFADEKKILYENIFIYSYYPIPVVSVLL